MQRILLSGCRDPIHLHTAPDYGPPPVTNSADHTSTGQQLKDVETQLSSLQLLLQQLTASCQTLEASAAQLRSRLAPIRRVPTEILQLIFASTVHNNDVVRGRMPALTLSHVCRRWRSGSNNSAALWTSIVASLASKDRYLANASGIIGRLKHCLLMSRDRPLDIEIKGAELYFAEDLREDPAFGLFFSTLVAHASRWRTMNTFCTPLLDSGPTVLANLATLVFTDDYDEMPGLQNLTAARNLRVFDMACHSSDDPDDYTAIPFHQLTSFAAFAPFQVLQRAQLSNLETLHFQPNYVGGNWDLSQQIHLPALTHLTLIEPAWGGPDPCLSTFLCPSLRELTLQASHFEEPFIASLSLFLSESKPVALTTLCLESCSFPNSFGGVLHQLRSIERLSLRRCARSDSSKAPPWTPNDLGALSHYDLLPSLRSLEISCFWYDGDSWDWQDAWIDCGFLDFLRCRTVDFDPKSMHHLPLESLRLDGPFHDTPLLEDFRKEVGLIRAKGFDINAKPYSWKVE